MSAWLVMLTAAHVLLSVAALLLGFSVVLKLVRGSGAPWKNGFIAAATATTLTGFVFPLHGVTPAIVVGIVASLILVAVFIAQPRIKHSRVWAIINAAALVASEYLLVFVAIAQAFTKVPALHALAPTLKEPPFAGAQIVALAIFIIMGILAIRRTKTKGAAFA